jgi:chemotaxis response regulator CheB
VRVLIVDDSPVLRGVLRLSLERTGDHEIVGEGANGREAIELGAALRPDVIILDMMMPEMTGVEALAVLREELPEVPVIMYSSMIRSPEADGVEVERPPGAAAWVTKSGSMTDLWAALERLG